MDIKEKCLKFLKEKLEPQRQIVMAMGSRWVSPYGPIDASEIEFQATYRLQSDILMEYEQQYSKLLDELKQELRNNQ